MKIFIMASLLLAGASVSAHEVTVKCTPKAFSCHDGSQGRECAWYNLNSGRLRRVELRQTVANPDIWFGRHQESVDGHHLTLDLRFDESKKHHSLRMHAHLVAANVMAEAKSVQAVDVALRNNTYGRGYKCTQVYPEQDQDLDHQIDHQD